MADITIKRGDTLIADCTYRNAAGVPVNLTTAGITVKSQARSEDGMSRSDLEVIYQNQVTRPGEFRLRADTKEWTAGAKLTWDIRYFRGADTFASRTLTVALVEPITLS